MGTWAWDATTGRVDWDEPLERLYGLEPGTFGGTMDDYLALLHPDDVPPIKASVASSIEAGADHDVEHRVMLADGGVRWIRGTGRSVVDPDGTVTGMVGVAADITDQRETQDARLLAEAAKAAAQDSAARSQARLALLGRISGVLGGSLDVARHCSRSPTSSSTRRSPTGAWSSCPGTRTASPSWLWPTSTRR